MLTFLHKQFKLLCPLLLIVLCNLLIACASGGSSSTPTPTPSPSPTPTPTPTPGSESLNISAFSKSTILIGESATATVSITNLKSTESVVVAISNNNNSIISVTPSYCTLSAAANSCIVKVTGTADGAASFSATTTGMPTVTSESVLVTSVAPLGIMFGTQNGLVFYNANLITGNAPLAGVDDSQIPGFAIDSNGNMYVGTQGASYNTNSPFGYGAGKVFKYNSALGYWTLLPGAGVGGTLDSSTNNGGYGSSVNVLIVDSNNNLYAGTNVGNVFKYANNTWSQMGINFGQPIKTLALDANNNLYAGTNNGSDVGDVYKYVSGTWVSLGSPDGTGIQSIAINSSGNIYAATAGYVDSQVDPAVVSSYGEVYKYTSSTTWNVISAFNDGTAGDNNVSVNSIVVNGSDLYAGTATGKVHKYNGAGTSWTPLGTPDTSSGAQIISMMLNGSNIYAGSNNNNDNGQVYLYDTGTTWNSIGALNNGGVSTIITKNNILYVSTANSGDNTGMVYTYSTNSAWLPVGTGAIDGTSVNSTNISSSGVLYAGTQNNVFKYLAANKLWVSIGSIYLLDSSGVMALATYESNVYAGMQSGNIYLTNNGGNWQQIASTPNYITSGLLVNNTGVLYTSMNYNDPNDGNLKDGRVQKYNSTTGVWTTLNGTGHDSSVDSTPIQSITMDTSGNIYAATFGNGNGGFVWKYPIAGSAWTMLGTGTLDGTSVNTVITDSSLNVYAGTSAGNVFKYNGLYWMQINTSPLDAMGVSSLNFDHAGNLYAATYGGMVWEYLNTSSLWVNTNYGIGVSINITGSSGI